MTKIVSLMTMRAAVSPVNCGLCEKPSALKKAIDLGRLATGRVMTICLLIVQ